MDHRSRRWVTDTVAFTHLARAGHLNLLRDLAPEGCLVVPAQVDREIRAGQDAYQGIPDPSSLSWVELAVLTPEEEWTLATVKAAMGGTASQHLGECETIAVAKHRDMIALLDDRAGAEQAHLHGVTVVGSLWIVFHAYVRLWNYDSAQAEKVVDDLLTTDMRLPVASGTELITHAYRKGWLPEGELDVT